MHNDSTSDIGDFVFFLDVSFTALTLLVSFIARDFFLVDETLSITSHVFLLPLLLVFITGLLSFFGAYEGPHQKTLTGYSWAITKSVVIAVGVLLVLLFFLKIEYVSRIVIVIFALVEPMVLLIIRLFATRYYQKQVKSGEKRLRIIIVGTQDRALELLHTLQQQTIWGLEVAGFIDPDPSCVGKEIEGIPVIGTVATTGECLKNNIVDEVIIAISRSLLQDAEPIVKACEEEGIRVRFMADVFNVQVARISLSQIGRIPLLNMEPVSQDVQQLLAKRLFDLSLTILAIPVLIPLFTVIAIAIKLDTPGPVFFVQKRVGLRKHIFSMYKFRTMCVDAEKKLTEIEHLNEAEGPIFKMTNDPRVTRVGKVLRRTSLDELPQLINVLLGDMSLVGPRPMSIRDVDLFDRGIQRKRFSVQPGITCLWQISGRSNLPFEKWLELDLNYIENWNFWFDVKILLKTLPAVLKAKGAV